MRQKELRSEFRDILIRWFAQYHPLNLNKPELIEREVEMALETYNRQVEHGIPHWEAESQARKGLYVGYQFSAYQMLMDVLEDEFYKELPTPDSIRYIAVELLQSQPMQELLSGFNLLDDFDDVDYEEEWQKLWYGMVEVTREQFSENFDPHEFWDDLVQSGRIDDYLHPLFS